MERSAIKFEVKPKLQQLVLLTGVLLMAVVAAFACAYLLADYAALKKWYLDGHECFYRRSDWATSFFTPTVKSTGNIYALIAVVLCMTSVYLIKSVWGRARCATVFCLPAIRGKDLWAVVAIVVAGASVCVWEWQQAMPAYDEVFSAVNCAEMRPSLTLSYYMLPNNHVAFNLLNSVVAGAGVDAVWSGRLLSAIAYVFFWVTVYASFRYLGVSVVLALVGLIPVAFQFHTLGFATQARGYELQLLFGWLALSSLWGYISGGRQRLLLVLNIVCNLIGFTLIPSYLFFYIGQLLFVGMLMVRGKGIDTTYLKAQLVLAAAVFLFYLPGLCFSGVGAYTGNKWVKPVTDNVMDFVPMLAAAMAMYIRDCFSIDEAFSSWLSYGLFALPLLLLFARDKRARSMGLLFIAIWVSFVVYSLYLRHISFHRTILIQFSITVFCSVCFVLHIVRFIREKSGSAITKQVINALYVVCVLVYGAYLLQFNKERVTWALYGYDINGVYQEQLQGVAKLPQGSSLTFSDDAFYFYYMCRSSDYKVSNCISDKAEYLIKIADRPFPDEVSGNSYVHFADCGNDYAIYRKLPGR